MRTAVIKMSLTSSSVGVDIVVGEGGVVDGGLGTGGCVMWDDDDVGCWCW